MHSTDDIHALTLSDTPTEKETGLIRQRMAEYNRPEAERIAQEHECIAAQASALSFQYPEFFRRMGYTVFGMSNGYPNPVKEYYLIKKFTSHLEQSV